jgi:hypothetical protein
MFTYQDYTIIAYHKERLDEINRQAWQNQMKHYDEYYNVVTTKRRKLPFYKRVFQV